MLNRFQGRDPDANQQDKQAEEVKQAQEEVKQVEEVQQVEV